MFHKKISWTKAVRSQAIYTVLILRTYFTASTAAKIIHETDSLVAPLQALFCQFSHFA